MDLISKLINSKGVENLLEEVVTHLKQQSDDPKTLRFINELSSALKNYQNGYKPSSSWKCAILNHHDWDYDSERDAEITWRTCKRCGGRQRGVCRSFDRATFWDWA